MKRISHLVVGVVLACGAQLAWSGEGHVPPVYDPRDAAAEANLSVAAMSGSAERQESASAPQRTQRPNVLEELGLAGHGPFPSSGGPIDGGD